MESCAWSLVRVASTTAGLTFVLLAPVFVLGVSMLAGARVPTVQPMRGTFHPHAHIHRVRVRRARESPWL